MVSQGITQRWIIIALHPPMMFLHISCGFSKLTSIFPSPKVPGDAHLFCLSPKEGTEGKGSAPLGVRRSFLRFLGDGAFDPPVVCFFVFPRVFWVAFFPRFLLDQNRSLRSIEIKFFSYVLSCSSCVAFFKSVSLQCMAKGLAPTHQWSELWIYFWFLERTFRVPLPVGGPSAATFIFQPQNQSSGCLLEQGHWEPETCLLEEHVALLLLLATQKPDSKAIPKLGNSTRHHHNGNSGVCWSHYPSKLRAQATWVG